MAMRFALAVILSFNFVFFIAFASYNVEHHQHFSVNEVKTLISALNKVLNFVDQYYEQINFDGLLGIIFAQNQLLISMQETAAFRVDVLKLLEKCQHIHFKMEPHLPNAPKKFTLFKQHLLDPYAWKNNKTFVFGKLDNLGIYEWSVETLLNDQEAKFQGIPTDVCVEELLTDFDSKECKIGSLCAEMMLENRNDTGYLLTHRLLYLQIAKLRKCKMNFNILEEYIENFCSLILKETKTNEHLGYPQRDIFLEQIFLCGSEGYLEFLNANWRNKIVTWGTENGCYSPEASEVSKRSANYIKFGCTDHATGLGAAALALNLRYILHCLYHLNM